MQQSSPLQTPFNPGARVRSKATGAFGTVTSVHAAPGRDAVTVEWDGPEPAARPVPAEDLEPIRQPPPRYR